jgi:hypothetical protein
MEHLRVLLADDTNLFAKASAPIEDHREPVAKHRTNLIRKLL